MNYLLDTNIVAFLYDDTLEPQYSKLFQKIESLQSHENLYVSILTLYELEYSIVNAEAGKQKAVRVIANRIKDDFQVLPLPEAGAMVYGELKTYLKKHRNINRENIKKHNIDLMMASTAITKGCILVSNDRVFEAIDGINDKFLFQNWLS